VALDNSWALVAGVASYRHVRRLPGVVLNDATDVNAVLTDPAMGGYPDANVTLLLDERATSGAQCAALADLAIRTDGDSTVFIFLSCHGAQLGSGSAARAYLLPVDAVPWPPERLAETAVSGEELSQALAAVPARKVVVVLDCCHAGGIGEAKQEGSALKSGLPEQLYEALQRGRGRVVMASSRSSEQSWIMPGASNSLFTQHLLSGIRGGIPSEDGLIRVLDIFEYVQPRVTADRPDQHPILKAHVEQNFPVALYLGGAMGKVPRDETGFRFDVYVSYVEQEPDLTWVWSNLVPRLEDSGLRVAVSGDAEQPGVARVVGVERGISQSRRTLLVLSRRYLADGMAEFENALAQTLGIEAASYPLLPVVIDEEALPLLPPRIRMLSTVNLAQPGRVDREFDRLIDALRRPLTGHLRRHGPPTATPTR
jgi:hypothetical protein